MKINIIIKQIAKIFFVICLAALAVSLVLLFEIYSAGKKIFVSNKSNPSIVKQLGEMIFSPSQQLEGEENDMINILLLGKGGKNHNGGDLTDTIIITGIKPQEKEAAFLSIPRDLYVQVPELNMESKINAIKVIGEKNGKNGEKILEQTIEDISGQKINYFVELDFQGFIKIIDDVGGIDIELENDINDPTYPNFNNGYDPFYISKGWHHLDGSTALKVARSRHSKMGDFDRIKKQQTIIKAFKQKLYDKYSSMDIIAFKNILSDLGGHLSTNIELKEIPRFYKVFKKIKSHKITAATFDTKDYLEKTDVGLGYTLKLKSDKLGDEKKYSSDIFYIKISDEKKELIKKEEASIEIQNGTESLDLANNMARDLELLGLRIVNSTNIAKPDFSGVRIYDNSSGLKPITIGFLKEKFLPVIIESPNSSKYKADFTIMLGKGF